MHLLGPDGWLACSIHATSVLQMTHRLLCHGGILKSKALSRGDHVSFLLTRQLQLQLLLLSHVEPLYQHSRGRVYRILQASTKTAFDVFPCFHSIIHCRHVFPQGQACAILVTCISCTQQSRKFDHVCMVARCGMMSQELSDNFCTCAENIHDARDRMVPTYTECRHYMCCRCQGVSKTFRYAFQTLHCRLDITGTSYSETCETCT